MSARLSPKQVEALRVLSERSGSAERLGLRMNTLYCLLRQRMATERANGQSEVSDYAAAIARHKEAEG